MLEQLIREDRRTPVAGKTDILVVGGGLAGVSAAVAAARLGKKVTLLEKSIVLGGLATLGHVCVYLPICDGVGNRVFGGQAEEFLWLCAKYGYNTIPACWTRGVDRVEEPEGRYQTEFNIPACVLALDELTQALGIEVLFDTVFCDVIMEGEHIRGVLVENKSGRSAYLADYVIDASGDADVAYRAGCPCESLPNIVSHWTFELNVDHARENIDSGEARKLLQMRWFGLRPDADNSKAEIPQYYGTTAEGVNGYIRTSRSLALDYLKKNDRPGLAMLTLPFAPQFRMTRRLLGLEEFVLTGEHAEKLRGRRLPQHGAARRPPRISLRRADRPAGGQPADGGARGLRRGLRLGSGADDPLLRLYGPGRGHRGGSGAGAACGRAGAGRGRPAEDPGGYGRDHPHGRALPSRQEREKIQHQAQAERRALRHPGRHAGLSLIFRIGSSRPLISLKTRS